MHNDRKECELKVIFYLFLEGLRKIMKILSQVVSLYSTQESNLALPECKSEVLLIEPCSSGTLRVIQTLAFKLHYTVFSLTYSTSMADTGNSLPAIQTGTHGPTWSHV